MAESFVEITGVPKDTEKRRLRTRKRTVGLDEVHEEAVFMVDGDGNIVSGSIFQALRDILLALSRFSPDSAGRMRVAAEAGIHTAASATSSGNYPTAGAPILGSPIWGVVWTGPIDQRWEMIQRSNIEYATAQRSRFTFA